MSNSVLKIAQHPGDPYGYEFFWYAYPEPAMVIVMPPVLPYWLALGIWDDCIQTQTIPNQCGTTVPAENRDHPRLRVGIYKILQP